VNDVSLAITNRPRANNTAGQPVRRHQLEYQTVSEDSDLSTVTGLIDDEYARSILTATSEEPMSATELAECCDASLSTVTRRLDSMEATGLIDEQTRLRSDGHHDTVYVAQLDRFEVRSRR